MGEVIEYAGAGRPCQGYLAEKERTGPGVIVIQEWWGLVPHIKDVCERLAADGFTALAPDLYHGATTSEPNEAAKQMMALDIPRAAQELGSAVDWVVAHTGRSRVGVVGFCMGGGLALHAAAVRPQVAACVVYYGVAPPGREATAFARIRAHVLGHWAERDGSTTHAAVDDLERRLREAGVPTDFHWYAGADHAFFNDARPEVYNPDAARLSWDRTMALFRTQLMEQPVG